jgi:hypothetical protein
MTVAGGAHHQVTKACMPQQPYSIWVLLPGFHHSSLCHNHDMYHAHIVHNHVILSCMAAGCICAQLLGGTMQ